jgi:hypothetical protein
MIQNKETKNIKQIFEIEDQIRVKKRDFIQELLELYDEDRHIFLNKLIMIIHRCNEKYEEYPKTISKFRN